LTPVDKTAEWSNASHESPVGLLVVVVVGGLAAGRRCAAGRRSVRLDPAFPAAERSSRDAPAALLSLNDEELARRVELDVDSLGSLSIGAPGSAILINPVTLAPGPYWEISERAEVFGTAETIEAIEAAVGKVHEIFPRLTRSSSVTSATKMAAA